MMQIRAVRAPKMRDFDILKRLPSAGLRVYSPGWHLCPSGQASSLLPSLLAGGTLRMWAEEERDHSIDDKTNPEVDQETEVGPQGKAAMSGSRGQMWHEEKVNGVARDHGGKRDKEISRQAHSSHLDTLRPVIGFQRTFDE